MKMLSETTPKWTRRSLFGAAIIVSIVPGFGALADPCDSLVSDLRAHLDADPSNAVTFHIASNYQSDPTSPSDWTVLYTDGELGAGETFQSNPPRGAIRNPHLSGKGTQTSSAKTFCREPSAPSDPSSGQLHACPPTALQNFDRNQAVEVQIDIFGDGSYMTQRQYGPFEATCYGNKFLTSFDANGYDTITFFKALSPAKPK